MAILPTAAARATATAAALLLAVCSTHAFTTTPYGRSSPVLSVQLTHHVAGPARPPVTTLAAVKGVYGYEVDALGNNVAVKKLLEQMQTQGLLSQVAQSGLLSKAQRAGISLSKLETLLAAIADQPDLLILVEASGPELLPILPTLIRLAPPVLPLLGLAVSVPPPLLAVTGVGVLGAAGYAITVIPDDSVLNVALQTLAVGLALPAAVAAVVGAVVLGTLTK